MNMIIDLSCYIILGLLLGSLFMHYLDHLTNGIRYSYVRLVVTIAIMFAIILVSSNIDGGWNKNVITEFIPFIVAVITAIIYVVIRRRVKTQ
jgi:hypothetical protein